MDFTSWLKANGYDEAQLSDAQKKHLLAAFKAETQPATQPAATEPTGFDAEMKAIERESERVAYIQKVTTEICKKWVGNSAKIEDLKKLSAAAIADKNMSQQAFDVQIMRAERMLAPMVLTPTQQPVNNDIAEAAVCLGQKLPNIDKRFSAQTLDAAERHFGKSLSLMELIGFAAQQNGYRGHFSKGNLSNVCRAAFKGQQEQHDGALAVGPSTISVPGILSNVANKFIRDAFDFVEADWRQIAAIRPVNDFKTITTYSLTGDLEYQELPPGGEIQHGTAGEVSYSNRAKTYAKLLGIDRQDLINDDLSAFTRVSRKLGRGGALKLNNVIWTEFLADSTFFPTDKSKANYDDGSDTLMDLTGLANANALFELQTDPDGKPAGIRPAIVLVPPQLWPAAFTLLNSANLNLATSTAASTGTQSPWAGMFRLVKSRYLSILGGAPGGLAWYLLADPNDVPVIEVCFLFGAEMPTVETGEFDFERLGMAMRGYHDFGASKQEYRAGVKMKGAN